MIGAYIASSRNFTCVSVTTHGPKNVLAGAFGFDLGFPSREDCTTVLENTNNITFELWYKFYSNMSYVPLPH